MNLARLGGLDKLSLLSDYKAQGSPISANLFIQKEPPAYPPFEDILPFLLIGSAVFDVGVRQRSDLAVLFAEAKRGGIIDNGTGFASFENRVHDQLAKLVLVWRSKESVEESHIGWLCWATGPFSWQSTMPGHGGQSSRPRTRLPLKRPFSSHYQNLWERINFVGR
jgi:hypothetical protein